MTQTKTIDKTGALVLIGFSFLMAANQVVIKMTNVGFHPVFQAGLRSLVAIVPLLIWMVLRKIPVWPSRENLWPSLLLGGLFSFEFICLFWALDLTSVGRSAILFYSMPIWLAIAAHFLLPNERLTGLRASGLILAILGVAWAVFDRGVSETASVLGDVLAILAALSWGSIALVVRLSRLSREHPETQLLAQLVISAPILLVLGGVSGEPIRDLSLWPILGVIVQAVSIAFFAFLLWFQLVAKYTASGVASFSFLSPVFGVLLGAAILGEDLHSSILVALGLVAVGLILINRKG